MRSLRSLRSHRRPITARLGGAALLAAFCAGPLAPPLRAQQPAASGASLHAVAWGYNEFGELGNNSTANSPAPVAVSSANGFVNANVSAAAAGNVHSLAIQNGSAYTWGSNGNGRLGNGSTANSPVPVAVSSANGFTNTGVTAVAAGYDFSLAIQQGTVYAWGNNQTSQLGNFSTVSSAVPVRVRSANGFNNAGVTAVAAGYFHSLAVQNGTVFTWGNGSYGQLGNNTFSTSAVPTPVSQANGFTNTAVTLVAGGNAHALALQNGAVYAWGYNATGQLGNGSTANSGVPVPTLGLSSGVTSLAAGQFFSLAVREGGVFAWGSNAYGQLGNGSTVNSAVPVQVFSNGTPLGNIVQVAAGQYSAYALAGDGSLWVWGRNDVGQLGDGTTTDQLVPKHLLPPTGQFYQLVAAGSASLHTVAILGDTAPLVVPALTIARDGTAGAYRFSFPTQAGITYQLQASGDLSAWANVPGQSATGDGTVQTLGDAGSTAARRFWRLSLTR